MKRSFKDEGEITFYQKKKKLKEFFTSILALMEVLQEVFQEGGRTLYKETKI